MMMIEGVIAFVTMGSLVPLIEGLYSSDSRLIPVFDWGRSEFPRDHTIRMQN